LRAWRSRLLVASGVGLLVLLGVLWAFGGSLVRAGLAAAGRLAGYSVAYERLEHRAGRLTVVRPDVRSLGGEPVFSAESVELTYSLRDVFGGPYFYGIRSVELDRPKLTVIRHRDGSFNIVLPPGNGQSASGFPALPRIHLVVKDGSAGLLDRTRIFTHSRSLALEDLQANVILDPHDRSSFTLRFALVETGGRFPVAGRGTFDERRGYEFSRLSAQALAIAPLFDYVLNSTTLHVANGLLSGVELIAYGLPDRSGVMQRHLSGRADLDHFQPYLAGLTKPLRDGRGRLALRDEVLAFPRVDGSIAGVPVRIAGAVYGFAHPALRLGIAGQGDLSRLVTLSDAGKALPLRGPLAFRLLVEGDATGPTTFAGFGSPGLFYGRLPLEAPQALVALHGSDTTIVRSSVGYAGAGAHARGRIQSGAHTDVELVADVSAPGRRVPYVAGLLGAMRLNGSIVSSGRDGDLRTSGVIAGATASEQLAGTFAVDGRGEGTIGPFALEGPGPQRLYARVELDRPHAGGGAAYLWAQNFRFSTSGPQPALPGTALPVLPPADGTLDGSLAATFAGSSYAGGASAHLYDGHALGYPIADLQARAGLSAPRRLAVDGRYRGDLAPLGRAGRSPIPLMGSADIPFSLLADGTGSLVAQIHDARFAGASVDGLSFDRLEGTLAMRGGRLDLAGARLRVAGTEVVAGGSLGHGGTLLISAAGLDLRRLRSAALPARGGELSAIASVSGDPSAPRVEGGFAATGVTLAASGIGAVPVDASTNLTFAGHSLSLRDALVQAGPAVGTLQGSVAGIGGDPGRERLAFGAHVSQADLGALAHLAKAPLRYPAGSLDADVVVRGSVALPLVRGSLEVPEGSLNGLRFRDGSVAFDGSRSGLQARDGRVTIGRSTLGFDADLSPGVQRIALRAPDVDLSDLNDYFDQGDSLGGRGSISVSARSAPGALSVAGRVRLTHTRFRRFDIGDTRLDASTTGRTLHLVAGIGGSAGRIAATGTLGVPATQPLRDTFARSQLALDLTARDVDLDTWLPAAGLQAPVAGLVNVQAHVRGVYPKVSLTAHADVQHGMLGHVAVSTATLDAAAANGRATITSAAFAIDNLSASGAGTIALHPTPALDLRLDARSADVGALAKTITGKTFDAAGSLHATLHLAGTTLQPVASLGLDGDALRYARFTVGHASAAATLTRTRATLGRAEIDFAAGRLLASGYAPLQSRPALGVGPPGAPLSLAVTAEGVGLGQFAALLPKGTQAAGTLSGELALTGSLAGPGLTGRLTLADGSFQSPQEKAPVTNAQAVLTVAGRTLQLESASAEIGGGTLAASGTLSLPNLEDPARDASAKLNVTSNNAVFDAPGYFRGRVLGALSLVRTPGTTPVVSGNLAFSSTRIVPNALLGGGSATPGTRVAALPVTFDVGIDAGNDVRVQGGPVDIGATGHLQLSGTLAKPALRGKLDSTGGTLSFYRTFTIQAPSSVTFHPSDGVIPDVDALATSYISEPPANVTLHVTGPATHLNVDLASDPSYSREQIVGILVGAAGIGAVGGVQTTGGAAQNPFQAAAAGELGNLLTQNVLEPFSSQLGSAVGLSNLAINYTPGGGGLGLAAQKRLFKDVNVVFADSFNYPPRQSIGVVASPNPATALQLTFFSQPSSNRFDTLEGTNAILSSNASLTSVEPINGSSGFAFSLQRKFP
jgi:hypothetical protein